MKRQPGYVLNLKIFIYNAFLCAILSGCNDCRFAEPIALPENALEREIQGLINEPPFELGDKIREDWWTLFEDEQLSCFIEKAFVNNPTLQSARRNILAATYNSNRLRSALFPNITWGADVSRQKLSETGIIPFNTNPIQGMAPIAVAAGQNGVPVYFTQYETEFILNYDFDIWGKNRSLWQAALSEVQARAADEAFSRLRLGISIAKAYFQIQVDYKRLRIAREIVRNREEYLDYVVRRRQNNIADRITVNLAETNLATATHALIKIENDLAVNEYRLKAYLAGDFEEQIEEIALLDKPLPKVPIPVNLPLHLVAYRPEIMAQLWLIESAGHQIDSARAGFYPDFNIMALYGFQTIHFQKFFQWPKSSYFNVDPAFNLPVFDGGKLLANLRGSEVNYDLAILRYNELLLEAVRNVLETLALLKNTNRQFEEFQKRSSLLEKNYELTSLKVQHNLSSKLDSLTSEEEALNALNDELLMLGNTLQALLSMIQALGGGFEQNCYEG